jgi:hypothetical protein
VATLPQHAIHEKDYSMLFTLHDGLSNTAMLFMLALTLWGFYRYLRGVGVGGDYLGALAVGEILLVVIAVLGIFLYAGGARPTDDYMHILYGICTLISLPAMYMFTRGRDGRSEMLLWAWVCLFVFGLIVRARFTGGA